jgi:hypothetical protein
MHSPIAKFFRSVLKICFLVTLLSTSLGCSNYRTESLQRRQDAMNDLATERAERRAIRSDNMDARSQALFDAM